MTATEELCRLLDERGVKHYDHENGEPLRVLEKAEGHATSWRIDGASCCAVPDGKGTFDVWIDHCTPEQAIAATLGSDATDVLRAIDQLRRDLSGYHDQLKAHDDLQRHCDNQRRRIAELEGLYAKAKAENAELRELVDYMTPIAWYGASERERDRMRELGVEVPK